MNSNTRTDLIAFIEAVEKLFIELDQQMPKGDPLGGCRSLIMSADNLKQQLLRDETILP